MRKTKAIQKASQSKYPAPTADEIAEMATRGEDVSGYFSNKFTVIQPIPDVDIQETPDGKLSTKPKSKQKAE